MRNAKNKSLRRRSKTAKFFSNALKKHLRQAKKKWIAARLGENNSKTIWRMVKTLTTKTKKLSAKPYYKINDQLMSTSATCELLNEYFTNISGMPSDLDMNALLSELPESEYLTVNIGQVKHWLKNIDTSKSTCSKDFPSWVTKQCSEDLCIPMCDLINHCLRTGVFPCIWKEAEVIPFEKSKSVESPSDFRPISLLWNLGKILERAIMYFYAHYIVPSIGSNQYAYQKGKCTTDAIITAVNTWTDMLDQKGIHSIPSAFLDMSKAFDRMDKSKLLSMLSDRCKNKGIVRIVNSFLSDRSQHVRLGNSVSANRTVNNGTPQGTLLGPMFWLLYIDTFELSSTEVIKYADDLTLIPRSADTAIPDLQKAIQDATSWCDNYNMIANSKKSLTMSISNQHNNHVPAPATFTMKGETLANETCTKFLGVHIDEHLTFKSHVDEIIKKTRGLIYSLLDLKRSGVPAEIMKSFYMSCIRSIVLYACPSWYSFLSEEQKLRLKRIESMASKIMAPQCNDYQDRICHMKLVPILHLLNDTSQQYIAKVIKTEKHCLHQLAKKIEPPQPPRRSARISHKAKPQSRTALRSKCPLIYYWC